MSVRGSGPTAACFLAVLAAACGAAPALADSLTFKNQSAGRYHYGATATNNRWDPGDVIALTGLEQVTDANAPPGFSVAFSPYEVTWTCLQQTAGQLSLRIDSVAAAGDVSWDIQSPDPGSGTVTGPAYVPEPETIALFGGGLILLVGLAWRRKRLASRKEEPLAVRGPAPASTA
ncbi:MAG: PEP-CTERM sorting domain-containing protein [Armatimonadota bacterium]